MHAIMTVFRKEILDGRRDRRALMSAFLFPVLGPALVYFMMSAIIDLRNEAESTTIPIQGVQNAPHFVQWLKEQDTRIEIFDGDPRQAVSDKTVELVIILPDDYQSRMAKAEPVIIDLVLDGSRTDTRATVDRVRRLIRQYSNQTAALRLVARGVSPNILQSLTIDEIDIASKQERAAAALNFIPMYIILAAFVAGMGIAIDTTAGERERKSLEALLINPIERFHLVAGKWLAASVFSTFGMVLTAVLCILAMLQVPLEEIGLSFAITPWQLFVIILSTAPVALLATSLQLTIGMFAKSFKDAQSYMGVLVFLPVIPSMYMMFNPLASKEWMFAVPIFGQQLMLVDLIGDKPIPVTAYFLSAGSCIVVSLLFVALTARLFTKESIITS